MGGGSPARSATSRRRVARGEEYGLIGSVWYSDHPTVPRDSIVAEMDEDMIGAETRPICRRASRRIWRLSARGGSRTSSAARSRRRTRRSPLPFVFDYAYDVPGHALQYYCRADHYNYARYGIPSVSLSRGEHLDYHQVTDEPQYIDYDALARVARMVHEAAIQAGSAAHRPKLAKPKGDLKAPCVQ